MPSVRVSVRGGRIVVSVPGRRGLPGTSGWTPILAIVNDGARRVHRVVDYTGGTGTKPATGLYVGPTGLVANIADAVDIGASGVGGAVTSVAGRNGDVVLTKTDVGLSNVDNTADLNKPVSTLQAAADAAVAAAAAADATAKAGAAQAAAIAAAATDATAKADAARAAAELTASTALSAHAAAADPHSGYQLKSGKDQPDGYAGVGGDGKIPAALLPSIAIVEYLGAVGSQSAMLALVGQKGDWCTRTDTGFTWIITGNDPTQISSWIPLSYPAAPVTTVAGRNGDVVLTKADVGLHNVDNTADLSKPVSTAQASADTAVANAAATALAAHVAATDPHPGYVPKQRYRTLWIGAGAMTPPSTGGAAAATIQTTTNVITYDAFKFDGATAESVWFNLRMPDEWNRGTVKAIICWEPDTSGTGAVVWGVAGVADSDNDVIDTAIGSEVTVADSVLAVGRLHVTTATAEITVGGSPALGDVIAFRIRRIPTDVGDTMTQDACLIGVAIQWREGTTEPAVW